MATREVRLLYARIRFWQHAAFAEPGCEPGSRVSSGRLVGAAIRWCCVCTLAGTVVVRPPTPASAELAAGVALPATCWTTATGTRYAADDNGYMPGAGDRLKITIYQRPEFSGEYQVREDGRISVPLLGTVVVDGISLAEIESRIGKALENVSGHVAGISVEVVHRRPFFVVGQVTNPGAYPFLPGTDVIRAIAMSGGLFRPTTSINAGAMVDISREAAKLGQAVAETKRNLVRRARLQAERDGSESFEAPPELLRIETEERVRELVDAELRLMRQRAAAHLSEKTSRESGVELAKAEIEALEGQHQRISAQVELAHKELDKFEDLLDRGLSRRGDLFTIQRVVANVEADEREVFARIQQAKSDLVAAERELALLGVNRTLRIEEEIATVEQQLAASQLSAGYSKRIIEDLTGQPVMASPGAESPLNLQIVRQTDEAPATFDASETTLLCPGDLLRVSRSTNDG